MKIFIKRFFPNKVMSNYYSSKISKNEQAKIAGTGATGGLAGLLAGIAINPIIGGLIGGAAVAYLAYKSIKNKINIIQSYNDYFANAEKESSIDFSYKISKNNIVKSEIPNVIITKNECARNLEKYLLENRNAELRIKKNDVDKYSIINPTLSETNSEYRICDILTDSIIYPGDNKPKGKLLKLYNFNKEILTILNPPEPVQPKRQAQAPVINPNAQVVGQGQP